MNDISRLWKALGAVRGYVDDGDIPPDAVWDELVDAVQMLIIINETLNVKLTTLREAFNNPDALPEDGKP